MEASERPQLPIDEAGGVDASVRAIDNRLVIEHLTVADERAARVVRERAEAGQPGPETVIKVIEIGARVLDREETAANVDYVRRELQSGLGELDKRLQGTLEAGEEALGERIASAFGADRNDSVQAQIKEMVAAATQQQREALMRVFSAEDGSNPLTAFQTRMAKALAESDERHRQETARVREGHATAERAMRKELAGLREELVAVREREQGDLRVAEAEQAGTRKGRSFEERVHAAIERIASARGDVAQHVGDERGEGGSKKGDTVVELGAADGPPRGRVVFEDKDDQLSKNKAWEELNGAMAERDADFAVLVVAGEEKVPAGREQLHEYEGNKLIVAVDPELPDELGLDLAYRYARCRVLLARDHALEVDAAGVRNAAEAARAALKRANSVRLALTNIDKSTEKAREGVEGIVADVEAELCRIEALIAAVDAEAD
jgi:hypothetical protein